MIFSLVYVSDCKITPFGDSASAEIESIKSHAQFNNDLYDVRGFLFYYQNHFLQIMQGDFDSIISVFGKIKNDPRHDNLRIIWFSSAEMHEFQKWSMAYSMGYASDNFKKLTMEPSTIGRFVPERGHLTPQSFRVLMDMATQTEEELNYSQDKLQG